MRHFSHIQLFSILCALVAVSARSQWRLKSFLGQGNSTAELLISPPPTPRLRQTTWQEIKARQVTRTSPNYKRQMASPVPISYPSCEVNTYGGIFVARFPNTEIVGGYVSLATRDDRDIVTEPSGLCRLSTWSRSQRATNKDVCRNVWNIKGESGAGVRLFCKIHAYPP